MKVIWFFIIFFPPVVALSMQPHVVKRLTKIPALAGATYLDNDWKLTLEQNNSYYRYQDAHGPFETSALAGIETLRIGIAADAKWGEDVDRAIKLSKTAKLAGFKYLWTAFFLKPDCCDSRTVPKIFKSDSGEIVDSEIYKRVEKYMYESTTKILKESELPVALTEVGNEIDGGFWTDFDANIDWQGPPTHLDKTKQVLQSAKRGVNRAYKDVGLSDPFYALHVMPDYNNPPPGDKGMIADFLSNKFVGENLFDVLVFSYYPNARPQMDPLKLAKHLRELGEDSGLPWGLAEVGVAGDFTPGPGGWNHFFEINEWCPKLFGETCTTGYDYQRRLIEKTHEIFLESDSFFTSIYLAPQENIIVIKEGPTNTILNERSRFAFWKTEPLYNPQANQVGQITSGFLGFKRVTKKLLTPKIETVKFVCDDTGTNCKLRIIGKNFSSPVHLEFYSWGNVDTKMTINEDKLNILSTSLIETPISEETLNKIGVEGFDVSVITETKAHGSIKSKKITAITNKMPSQ